MAELTEVTVRYMRKINLGNYSSMDLGCTLTFSVDKGEGPKVIDEAFELARKKIGEQGTEILKNVKEAGDVQGSADFRVRK